jgi:hypothetical protein
MRDILGDLEERANLITQEINKEKQRFEELMLQV